MQRCFDVVSTFGIDVVSTLCNVESPTWDFVSFSTSDQLYFNVDPRRWNNVDPTWKYWLGKLDMVGSRLVSDVLIFSSDILVDIQLLTFLLLSKVSELSIGAKTKFWQPALSVKDIQPNKKSNAFSDICATFFVDQWVSFQPPRVCFNWTNFFFVFLQNLSFLRNQQYHI